MHTKKFVGQTELKIPRLEIRVYLAPGIDPSRNQPGTDEPIYEAALVWVPPGGGRLKTTTFHLDRLGHPMTRTQVGGLMYVALKQLADEHCTPNTAKLVKEFIDLGGPFAHNA